MTRRSCPTNGLRLLLLAAVFVLSTGISNAQTSRIYSISPAQVQSGGTAFPMVINGANFSKNSRVQLGGVDLDTYFVSWNKLRAVVPASLTATAGTPTLRVVGRGRVSNQLTFTISVTPVGSYNWNALTAKLQSYISTQTPLPENTVRGLTFMLSRNGRVVYSQAFGNQTVDSVLPIASSSKMPSMLAIMTLVDQGLVNLDTPIGSYLQGYATVPTDKSAITLRMLMNHTSGLPQPTCLNDDAITLRQCTQQILNAPLLFAPGTQFSYGGGSMHVAGGVAESVTGQGWNQFFAERVATPLGLTRFTYGTTTNPRIAGGVSSDVGDYSRILQTFIANGVYNNTRIISSRSYFEMITDQKRDLPIASTPVNNNDLPGYSYGWWHSSASYLQSQPTPNSAGPEFSDQGAFGCTPFIDLDRNYTAIILIQRNVASGTAIWNGIRPYIIEQIGNGP